LRAHVPMFFFDLYDDMTVIDDEGAELPGLEQAREHALQNAAEIACTEVLERHLNLKHRIEVRDESGATVATVRFADVVKVEQ
jgi:hypothetical protein